MGKIAGFCHLYIGQEAVAVGCIGAAKDGDAHITSYRDHGHILALGTDPGVVLAELMGRSAGCSKGKGGSMHMFDTARGFYGGHGIVGAQVPIGTGMALADKYLEKDTAIFVYYGDGAAHQGQIYESFNMAKLWNLGVIYVIENNEYAMGTSVERSTAVTDLSKRGESFGIPGLKANGMDIFDMERVAKEARNYVAAGKGPILIEAKTYRYRGHSMSDPAKYRTKEEVECYKETKDSIAALSHYILKNKLCSEAQLKETEDKVKKIVLDALAFAENSPEPHEDELYTEVC